MDKESLINRLKSKPDPDLLAAELVESTAILPLLFEIVLFARPEWEKNITERLVEVPGITYLYKGEPSPECNRIACGYVLECFEYYFDCSGSQSAMINFAECQLGNSRKTVAKLAEKFLINHPRR